jgi:hypothetical protein
MSLSLGLAVLVSVQAAAPNEPWVVLMRRSGVAAPKAMEVAKAVSSQLGNSGIPSTMAVEDVTKCNGKKPCLIDLGRKKKVPAMVLVEVGTVLDDAFARAEAISIEEDGKRIGVAEVEGKLESLSEALRARVAVSLVPPLRSLLGIEAPPPAEVVKETPPVKPEPVSEVPPPMPPVEKPVEVVTAAPEPESKPFFTGGRVAGLIIAGAGAGTLIVSGIFGGIAAGAAGEQRTLCPEGTQCSNPAAFTAYNNAASAQNTSLVLMGVGVGLAAVGVVVMLIPSGNSEAPAASVTMMPVPGGMAASVSGSF